MRLWLLEGLGGGLGRVLVNAQMSGLGIFVRHDARIAKCRGLLQADPADQPAL
jgi:hypothetical protein